MPIRENLLDDFSGGEIDAIASNEPDSSQWLRLEGFVLDNNRRLRSQWSSVTFYMNLEESS